MTREEAKIYLPFVTALAEGRKIQTLDVNSGDWEDIDEITVDYFLSHHLDYRVKPEPTYRPFRNVSECWNEMQKHQPFGWLESQRNFFKIIHIDDNSIGYGSACGVVLHSNFDYLVKDMFFADGTPFGMEEE